MQVKSVENKIVSVFNYLDYREFLKDFYEFQKGKHSGYSFRVFAMKAKLSSQNYLKLVMDGKRRITDKMLSSFIRGLGLNSEEAKYFRLIVMFNETSDLIEKRELLTKIVVKRNRKSPKFHQVNKRQEHVLKHWSHWVIRELVLLDNFKADPSWISEILKREISPKQAQESLDLLLETGMIEKKENRFLQTSSQVKTDDEVVNCLIRDLHAQLIELGVKSLFRDELRAREFAGLTISLSEEQIPKFKEKIKEFRQSMNAEFSNQNEKLSKVYHLEIMFFPISKGAREC